MNREEAQAILAEIREIENRGPNYSLGDFRQATALADKAERERDRMAVRRELESLGASSGPVIQERGMVTDGRGLWGAIKSQGFDVKSHPVIEVPVAQALGVKTASFDGTIGTDTLPQVVPAPGLGADDRFLYPKFPIVSVAPDVANVSSYRAKERTLADPSDMIRDIDEVGSDKPETDTTSEVTALVLSQVANVSSGIPLILFSSQAFMGWVQSDVELAWRFAIDTMIVDAIAAATPPSVDGSPANDYESILYAMEAVRAAGYRANLVALSPADALSVQLLQLTGGDSYAFRQELPTLAISPSIDDGAGFVADTTAAGTLYASPTRFETFVDEPKKNTYIARYENNSGFQVHRADAVCMLSAGS